MPKIVAEKTAWIKLGFELFARHGAVGIVVDKMAGTLKCNRSSFYWHFKSKKEFINEIISYWTEADTEQIIVMTEKAGSPKQKFKNLVEVVFKKDPYMDFVFHIKRYATRENEIQRIIDEIDQRRINYVSSILVDLGYSERESDIKARLFYKYLIGYHEMLRYKPQTTNYVKEVCKELRQFISI